MVLKSLFLTTLFSLACFAQVLPEREELVKKFLVESTSAEASRELIKHFQMGGLRTIIRNMGSLPYKQALEYGASLRYMNLSRFGNDLNTNLNNADGPQTRAMYLMLLATIGRTIAPETFETVMADESAPMYVRLAAASGVIKVQNPAIYDRFIALADDAEVDPATGKNDLQFADIGKNNIGFFLYTKGKIGGDDMSHGSIICTLAMIDANDVDVYEELLDAKEKKYFDLMIDRAVKIGGVQLLETMQGHKAAKKYRDKIAQAMPAAQAIAQYTDKLLPNGIDNLAIGPALFPTGTGSGTEGFSAAVAVAKISASGEISIVTHQAPFGGTDDLKSILAGKTFPAHNIKWEPVDSYVLVIAP